MFKKSLLVLALLALIAAPAFASVGISINGTQIGVASVLNFPAGTTYTTDGFQFSMTINSAVVAAITSGTIDGVVIGGVSPGAVTATTLTSTGLATLASAVITGNASVGGILSVTGNATVGGILGVTGKFTSAAQNRISNISTITGVVVTNSGSTETLSGANMAKGSIFQETGSTAATFTLDTGTALSTAVPGVQVGDTISFVVSNASTALVTIAGATGTTVTYVMTVPTLTTRTCYAINTGSNTWSIY
jgi:hypothetical protein